MEEAQFTCAEEILDVTLKKKSLSLPLNGSTF